MAAACHGFDMNNQGQWKWTLQMGSVDVFFDVTISSEVLIIGGTYRNTFTLHSSAGPTTISKQGGTNTLILRAVVACGANQVPFHCTAVEGYTGSGPTACARGTYKGVVGSDEACQDCPANGTSTTAAVNPSQCIALPGYTGPGVHV